MAKINLLTIHYGNCYGAVMQTYATCRILESIGHEVIVINLIDPRYKLKISLNRKLVHLYKTFQFWLFKKCYFSKMTKKMFFIENKKIPPADITIVGSDQVWNKDITGIFNYTFYLDFVPNYQKKFSLSSSFGKNIWNEATNYTEEVKRYLSNFTAISVREASGSMILKNVFELNSTHLLDPTLAWGDFEHLTMKAKEGNYIYSFLLNNEPEARQKLSILSSLLKCKVFTPNRFINHFFNGPRHWLTRIRNAKYVVTDSFHGLALSLIFKKEFYIFCANESKFTRIESLLHLLNLGYRYIKDETDLRNRFQELIVPINYREVERILEKERNKYRDFVNSIR